MTVEGLPKRLELGCKEDKTGWVTVDVRGNPTVKHDISEGLPFDNETFEEVRAFHLIEHIHWTKTMFILREVHRVLEKGGKFHVSFPNFDAVIRGYLNGESTGLPGMVSDAEGPGYWRWAMYLTFGHGKNSRGQNGCEAMMHKAAFDSKSIKDLGEMAGFSKVEKIKSIQSRSPHDRDVCFRMVK